MLNLLFLSLSLSSFVMNFSIAYYFYNLSKTLIPTVEEDEDYVEPVNSSYTPIQTIKHAWDINKFNERINKLRNRGNEEVEDDLLIDYPDPVAISYAMGKKSGVEIPNE